MVRCVYNSRMHRAQTSEKQYRTTSSRLRAPAALIIKSTYIAALFWVKASDAIVVRVTAPTITVSSIFLATYCSCVHVFSRSRSPASASSDSAHPPWRHQQPDYVYQHLHLEELSSTALQDHWLKQHISSLLSASLSRPLWTARL